MHALNEAPLAAEHWQWELMRQHLDMVPTLLDMVPKLFPALVLHRGSRREAIAERT
jgi:hypothetical protein